TALFDGWGYVRLLDRSSLEQVDAYAIDEALDPDFAFGFGDLSVHEVAVDPVEQGLAYLSYYSGGLRVIRYGNNGIREVGHYIHKDGNNFWGIETHLLPDSNRKLILASDRDSGLWIFKYTGPTDPRLDRFVGRKAILTGRKEVPGPGDRNGKGTARINLHSNKGRVCYRVSWRGIDSPNAAHIHEGSSKVAGPIVVTLFQEDQPLSGNRKNKSGCIKGVDSALVADIMRTPRDYYVNVHNPEFPAGAIRGQLFNP
ncbi:MAG: CHRD domain-containing protein, partial [Actinomycetota bacterium]|nr:CHRD domain-containing protein [Actinomycetota bacterium]